MLFIYVPIILKKLEWVLTKYEEKVLVAKSVID